MKPLYITLPALLLLTACGGGGGGDVVTDVPDAQDIVENADGAEDATDEEKEDAIITVGGDETPVDGDEDPVVPTNQTFNLVNQSVISTQRIAQADRIPEISAETFQAVYNTNGTITLTYDGKSVILGDTDGDGNFSGSANSGTENEVSGFLRRRYQGADNVETVFFNFSDNTTRLEGYLPVGELASTAAVNAQSGTATFRGLMNARIIGQEGTIPGVDGQSSNGGPDFVDGLGGGRLTVNFDAGNVSGRFNLNDPNAGLFTAAAANQFPRVLVELDSAIINGAAFAGTADVTFKDDTGGFGNPAISFDETTGAYSGNFYGDAANSAGGIVTGEIINGADRLVFQGAFATENDN